MTHPEIELEQAHVDRAYARLETLRDAAQQAAARVAGGPVVSAPHGLLERDALFYARRERYVALSIGDEPLVFGRIDTRDREAFHIGRVGVTDEDHSSLVVDWRAPAAAAFYRATPGDPGVVVRRRHLHCRAQKVLSIDDELLDASSDAASDLVLVGEAALLRAVGRARTGRMRDIVATIQVEQDKIIRAPLEGVLVVQGGPGTGKTAVGLHRAAYLLYTHRHRLERSGVLLVGPDPIFLRYVDQVLPSLGESAARLSTTSELVDGVTVTARDNDDAARVKGDVRMIKVVRRAIDHRQSGVTKTVRILYGGEMLELTTEATERIVDQVAKMRGTHNQRRRSFVMAILFHLMGLFRAEMNRSYRAGRRGPSSLGSNVPHEERVEFFEAMLDDERVTQAIDDMWPVLSPQRLLRELYATEDALAYATAGILSGDERDALVRPPDVGWTNADVAVLDEARVLLGPQQAARPQSAPQLDEEERWMIERMLDDLSEVDPIIASERGWLAERYLDVRADLDKGARGPGERRTYGHVIVDEAQDLSPMQWRMIARRCPSRSMTILGDLAQATSVWAANTWEQALGHLRSRREPVVSELTINYRTPTEIMDAANRVLDDETLGLSRPRSVRDGEPPRFVETEDAERSAADIAIAQRNAIDGTVAVIAPRGLVERIRSHLGEGAADAGDLDAPIVVLEVGRVKGLEFDSVVVVEPERIVRESGPRALYVALTRPTQTLTIVHAEPLPEALQPSQ